ncbi:MAG: MFS transporter [Candidatus Solibacter usitatus]|nr:MFS transporter [Candidatus Solibacter usitatus]
MRYQPGELQRRETWRRHRSVCNRKSRRGDLAPISHSPAAQQKAVSNKQLAFLFVTVFLDLLGAGILLPVIPYLVRQFRTDATTVGALAMSFSAAQFVASPVLGVLSDRYGRRPVLLLSIFGTSVGYFIFALASSLPVMFLSRLLDGFTGGNISTAQAYIADVSAPENRAKSFGLLGAAFGLGFMLGPAIGGWLSNISLQAPAYAAGVLSLATTIFGLFALPESLPAHLRGTKPFHFSDLSPITPLRQLWDRKILHRLLLGTFFLNFAFSAMQSNFTYFTMERFQYTAQQNGTLFVFIGISAAISQGFLVRKLTPVLGERRMGAAGLAALIIGFLVVAFSTQEWHLFVSIAFVAGVGLASVAFTALLSQLVSPREQGWLLGSLQSVLSLTRLAGPIYAGIVFDAIGSGAPYWTGAIWMAVSLLLLWTGSAGRANEGK